MPTLKSSPSELAIHGGGPPAFASKVPAFSANVGDGQRFAQLAERMFMASERPGAIAEEFESAAATWLGVRNVIGFSSLASAVRGLSHALRFEGQVLAPAFGSVAPCHVVIDSEPNTFGVDPAGVGAVLAESVSAVFATHLLGRPCRIRELEDHCDEWDVPLFFYGHQALGSKYNGERLGAFGRAEVFDLGRDQLIHATDAAVISTNDDLLAYRLRSARAVPFEGIDQSLGDPAAAMGIANLESSDSFIAANRLRYARYKELLADVPGMNLVAHAEGDNYQSVAIEVDPRLAGLTRDSLFDVLIAENVGCAKPLHAFTVSSAPIASRLNSSLLQLPAGPGLTDDAIEAICKLVELAIVRSLESPDPLRLAA